MNKTVTMVVLLVVILLALGLYVINTLPETDEKGAKNTSSQSEQEDTPLNSPITSPETQTYRDPEMGISFRYETGPTGYVLDTLIGTAPQQIRTLRLVTQEDSPLLNDAGAHDGPTAILIQAFEKGEYTDPLSWAEAHATETNMNLKVGEIIKTEVAGADAIRYTIDGLYPTDIVIALHSDFAYVISGSYLDKNSPTKKDFEPLLRSIAFIP